MLQYSVFIAFILLSRVYNTCAFLPEDVENTSSDCITNSLESSIYCRGSRVINNIITNLSKTDKPIVVVRGLEIVPTRRSHTNATNNAERNYNDDIVESDDTFLGRFSRYLRTHELNIKFSDLMTAESELFLARDPEQTGMQMNVSEEARKKDKGNGLIMAIAILMTKMMAVLGLGGVGALAMKAMGVALTALMIAGLVGMKSLVQQGHEPSSHSVQYVTPENHLHRRRRRSNNVTSSTKTLFKRDDVKTALPPLVYRGWQK